MSQSLEWNCEEAIRLIMLDDSRLAGLPYSHYDKDSSTVLDTVILKAEKGAERLDASKASDVTVKAIYASASKSAEDLDIIAGALSSAVYKGTADISMLPFEDFIVEPETSTDRSDGRKIRKRVISFPLIAKLLP